MFKKIVLILTAAAVLGCIIIGCVTYIKTLDEVKIEKNDSIFASNSLVNINTADKYELMSLPYIGEVISDRIIEYRNGNKEFKDINELKLIKGINEKNFEVLKALVSVKD